ncbi:acyl-CoA dehydrogenase, N-terminal domain protein [Mycolicibacterium hassiacum DSM 44199]|jgi:alkylation response protein AidB-like acyl-CoA dehydrogenase|uniref:Acyl-CoA dehydrogenase, N-terminal domain protein n=1 Tax=Mycolicibacterium hassiacum (strain DSM 44199 / CIP 105218 / JCM 12690 / 3849) TaxID=1122247 RepID=K5BD91_MYCHD|nr:acyl-CoA dehydrogenase family protein [Mycolicibacterium hassiacum]EKF21306.1 acyl-CoA dehydrogenase, N-terminal domain protein [Mycolicibacterium hassiacum DSM 44199]MDA4087361.1 acyl-CoA dehydrogenase [Mycolicibacterium hassiacum DSM 44199]VCT92328.1 Putative acyl-CoA dehydrogenase FadE17 [Mycolicibacterium hassiacum DSM 44199]
MDLNDSPAEARFRARLRAWLADTLPTLPWPEPADMHERRRFWSVWQRKLFDAGFAGLSWPAEYGGAGADAKIKAIFNEELDRAGAPDRLNIIGEDFAGPTIVAFGTDEQKRRYLEPILKGDEIWCQLFSEPESGSDLASLRTTATKVDGGWKINGQKIWTSRAQIADNAILLARTGGGERHKGITYFLVSMASPGITVRPLAHMLGEAEFNEVFLDDVFVPDGNVVGAVDGGWKVAMATLSFERVGIATGRVNTTRAVADLVDQIKRGTTDDGRPLAADPLVRQRIADLYGRALTHYLIGQRVITGAASGEPPGPVTSIGKLYFCPLVEDIADFGLELTDFGGQFGLDEAGRDDTDPEQQRWLRLAYQARGTAIAGGSTFIQRNIAAERVLGMPRG